MKKTLLFLLLNFLLIPSNEYPADNGWNNLNKILKNIKPPKFRDKN